MTLLKRLQADAVAKFETQIRVQHINQTDLENVISNTVTTVLDEVEREVEFRQKGWIGAEEDGSDRDPRYDELQTVLAIIQSKRTEI